MMTQSTPKMSTQRPHTHVRRGRHGLLALTLGLCLGSGAAHAGDSGFRVELAPIMSYAKETATTDRYLAAGAQLQAELWGLGPFGIMLKAGEQAALNQIELTDAGIVPVTTYLAQATLGPTLNFQLGPLAHVRLAGGPWIGVSWLSTKSLQQLSESDLIPDWQQAAFLGSSLEGRVDFNLPILSPFVVLEGRTHALSTGQDVNGDTAEFEGVDLKGTAGVRLNVLPLVKLSLAGHAGYTSNVIEPVAPTVQDLTNFGLSLGLVIMR